jgi:glycosyltransferase involved in cell wall biosynthesis
MFPGSRQSGRGEAAPKVSVIMPAYNAGRFVVDAVESVLTQEGLDFELLVHDDGSSDDTRSRLERYFGHSRVRSSFSDRNRGSAATRNALIRNARAPYVMPCDADDLMLPGNLSRQADFLDLHPEVGVVYGDLLVLQLDDEGRIIAPPSVIGSDCNLGWDLKDNLVNHGGSMSRRHLVLQVGGYDESVRSVDDWSLWLKMAEVTRFHYLEGELLYVWRRHQASLTRADADRARDTERIIREAAQRRAGR